MYWRKRGPGSPSRRRVAAFRPSNEALEARRLLTAFDLTTTQTAPLGVEFVGKSSNNTAGYKVTDVGNVTGSGFDSFVVSAPGLPFAGIGGTPNFSLAGESAAYLVFGSKQVNLNTVADYLTLAKGTTNGTTTALTGGNRAGDLGELGTLGVAAQSGVTNPTAQTNPTVAQPQPAATATHVYGFNYDGLTLVTGLDTATGLGRNSALGFSVTPLGDVNNDGFDDFAISAPNDTGGGKVFVIYGGAALATQPLAGKTIDLEPTGTTGAPATSATFPTKLVSLSLAGGSTGTATTNATNFGYGVGGIGNYFNNNNVTHDLAIGVPGLTVGTNANAGAVFAISGSYLTSQATGFNIDLTPFTTQTGTTTNAIQGIEYTGTTANGRVGTSVSTAGNFDGSTGSNGRVIDSLLIGAPGAFFGGGAYLVYGSQAFTANATLGSTQSLGTLGVAPTTNPVTNPLQGVVFGDQTAGDRLGFAVSTAGDFNTDGAGDIILGAPGYNIDTGYADIIYGVTGTATTTTSTRLNGIFTVSPTVANAAFKSESLIGEGNFDYAGYSLAVTSHLVLGTATVAGGSNDVLIGSPGNQIAYLVPGTAAGATQGTGTQNLSTINTAPLNGNEFVVSGLADPAVVNGGFATSVSARNPIIDPNTLGVTVDNDAVADLFFGAPFSSLTDPTNSLTVTRNTAGVAYVFESGISGGTTTPTTPTGGSTSTLSAFFPNASSILNPIVFTGDLFGQPYPAVNTLEHLTDYQALPVQLAYQQFRVQPGFLARENFSHHPSKKGNFHSVPAGTALNVAGIRGSENRYLKYNAIPQHVYDRGKLKIDKSVTFTHKVKVIPRSEQTQTFVG